MIKTRKPRSSKPASKTAANKPSHALAEYNRKRNFSKTREPKGELGRGSKHRFVVQEHHASKLHYDFRLELGGVLKSWAVPRGPSLDPSQKRLAVMTEDHPVKYLTFKGKIAEGEYGAGEMRIWDTGIWKPGEGEKPEKQLQEGRFGFALDGDKLKGEFTLVQMKAGKRAGDGDGKQWLLIKAKDKYAQADETLVPILRGQTRTRPNRSGKGPSVQKFKVEGKGEPVEKILKKRQPKGNALVGVDKDVVALTSLDRAYFPEKGYTKADLLLYYHTVADTVLPYLRDRPLILKRYPLGVDGKFFFQHNVDAVPDYVETYTTKAQGHTVDYVLGNNQATLLYLANQGVIPMHPWHSRIQDIHHPDWIVLDLDPGKVEFEIVRKVALRVKAFLDALELESYPKTSGSRGLHVYIPIEPRYLYAEVAEFAERLAKGIVAENPEFATIVRSLRSRQPNQVYIDHLQNAEGKTIVAPYSVRERAAATVSAPLEWQEVKGRVIPGDFTIKTMPKRLDKKGDLFSPVLKKKQSLKDALKRLDSK